jgi:hypothetical protein
MTVVTSAIIKKMRALLNTPRVEISFEERCDSDFFWAGCITLEMCGPQVHKAVQDRFDEIDSFLALWGVVKPHLERFSPNLRSFVN